ncbi:hypothetical protein KP001_09220 [Geomonas subterranea]|uniref:Uncharacterized protein n=1 Tax=Geomonas subterranea TaxID=2847989 RepID=A0ABX8LQZ9_9BACT|nr:hypothetical protein [Geomonas subterranea]QXE92678.1 hypothetical protein KP001_09220 [Geomonas subterranea]QXM09223.1 hypothetical protein KP002_20055 [Geomonas subterranea]
MKANAKMAEELKQLDVEIEVTLAEQSRAFQKYMQTALHLRRALRQTVQLSDQEWTERIIRITKCLRDDLGSIEINAAALTLIAQSAARAGMRHLKVGQDPTADKPFP